MLGLPVELFTPIFAIARIVGWCAHRLEEIYTSNNYLAKNINDDGHLSWNSSYVQVDEAFEFLLSQGVECSEVMVAVIDTGVHSKHNYFDNENKKRIIDSNYTYTAKYKNENDGSDYTIDQSSMEDDHYHGTHISGTIFDNSMENVKIVPYMVCPYCGEETDMELGPDEEIPDRMVGINLGHKI